MTEHLIMNTGQPRHRRITEGQARRTGVQEGWKDQYREGKGEYESPRLDIQDETYQ